MSPFSDPVALTPFLLLLAAVAGLWIHRYVWLTALAAAVIAAYFTGALRGFAVCWIFILGAMAVLYRWRSAHAELPYFRQQRVVTGLAFFGFALAMGLGLFPGFPRTVLIDNVILSPGAPRLQSRTRISQGGRGHSRPRCHPR